MYICIYVYMYICIYVYMYICIYVYAYLSIYLYNIILYVDRCQDFNKTTLLMLWLLSLGQKLQLGGMRSTVQESNPNFLVQTVSLQIRTPRYLLQWGELIGVQPSNLLFPKVISFVCWLTGLRWSALHLYFTSVAMRCPIHRTFFNAAQQVLAD